MTILVEPLLFCALCVSFYWAVVCFKVVMIVPKIGKLPNVFPTEVLGILSRAVMLPLIVLWIYFPWKSVLMVMQSNGFLAWFGALCCCIALGLSLYCWHYMGTTWRIGINLREKNQLIVDGPFKYVRHPIYALSILLMFGSLLCLQTKAMFVLFVIHGLLFTLEAYREEHYLLGVYGQEYDDYLKKTSRFFPVNLKKLVCKG